MDARVKPPESKPIVAGAGQLPDFLVIGAMKSGTTTLHEYLGRHPDVFMCTPKEPQFFSRDHVYARGVAWYRGLYAQAGAQQVRGEASTCYTRCVRYPAAAERIAQHLPDVRLIYIMRHPVERAYSHYRHEMQQRIKRGRTPLITFEDALETDAEIIDASLYLRQIERYLRHFARERLLLLTLDELGDEPVVTMRRVQEFLGVPVMDLTQRGELAANRWGDKLVDRRLERWTDRVRHAPLVSSLVGLLPQGMRSRMRRAVLDSSATQAWVRRSVERHKQALSPLTAETRARLLARFEQPTRALEAFLGRRLGGWFA